MSLLGPAFLLGLKALRDPKDPKDPWLIRVYRTSRVRPPVRQDLATSHRTWEAGAVAEPPALCHSVACHIRLLGGFLRDKSSHRWVTVRGILIHSSLAPGFPREPLALLALLDKVAKRQLALRLLKVLLSKSRLQLGLPPTGNPRLLSKPRLLLLNRRP